VQNSDESVSKQYDGFVKLKQNPYAKQALKPSQPRGAGQTRESKYRRDAKGIERQSLKKLS
jgi:hypothetical protein